MAYTAKMIRLWNIIYVTFCGGLVLALVVFLASAIYPEFPNTPTSKSSLKKELGIDPSTVDSVYHDYSFPDFHGDAGHYFRFRYPSERWVESFKSRFQAERLQEVTGGLARQNLGWWDWRQCREIECYRMKGTGNAKELLWVDKEKKLVYVNIYNW